MTMNPRQNAPTFEFADSSPVRLGRKHRRGGATPTSRKSSSSAASSSGRSSSGINNNSAATGSDVGNKSYRNGGHNYSSAASELSSSQLQQHQQANYYTGDAWDNPNQNNNNANKDDNSCTGSLTYSASSSVQDESSNDSSFADIIKLIDSEGGEGSSEIKDFIAKQSKAAIGSSGSSSSKNYVAAGGGVNEKDAAVAGWMQRVEDRSRLQHQHAQSQTREAQEQKQKSRNNRLFSMEQSKPVLSNSHVDLNYSKDDSSEDDVFGVDFDDNVLETIAGLDEDIARHVNVTVVTQSQPAFSDKPFRNPDFHSTAATATPLKSLSPRGLASGHVTPPPNSRHKRSSTPPGAKSISRTSSRHSKSSSDGSWDTPAPSSPPNTMKPPHVARSMPGSISRRKSGRDEKAVEDLSEAIYAKSWMCGFADAFNFDGFDKFQK